MASIWKKMTGHSWKSTARYAVPAAIAVAGAMTGGLAVGLAAAAAYEGGKRLKEQDDAMKKAMKGVEALAAAGQSVDAGQESQAVVDEAGNEAYRRKRRLMAATLGVGRQGTVITSSLGGGGKLG